MRLEEIMSTEVETTSRREPAEEAWRRMKACRIHHLVVVEDGEVVGVVTERDLGGPRGADLRRRRTVDDLMTSPAVIAGPDTTVREAANILRGRRIGSLPIAARGRLVGIVTASDLLELLGRGAERPVPKTRRWTLKHRGAGRRATAARAGILARTR